MSATKDGKYVTHMVGNALQFDLPVRYKTLEPIGRGQFGCVFRALDSATGEGVAIKKLYKPFESKYHSKMTYREMKLLLHMRHDNSNILQILDVYSPAPHHDAVYMVTELMDENLSKIKGHSMITVDHIFFFMYQILRGLKFAHSAGIVHRDLKPENILIKKNLDLKIGDWGLGRSMQDDGGAMTGYVQTRWYRAPELLLNRCLGHESRYDAKVDMWSVGCIFYELLTGRVLFQGQDDSLSQLKCIIELHGLPPTSELAGLVAGGPEPEPGSQTDLQKLLSWVESEIPNYKTPQTVSAKLQQLVPGLDPDSVALINELLVFNPERRLAAHEAINQPLFLSKQLHDPTDEPNCPHFDDAFEHAKGSSVEQWRHEILAMCQHEDHPVSV